MKSSAPLIIGIGVGLLAVGGVALAMAGGKGKGGGGGGGVVVPNPDVSWGKTPSEFRQLFTKAEQVAAVPGLAGVLAALASQTSGFNAAKHDSGQAAVNRAQSQYLDFKGQRPALSNAGAAQATAWGSGGLFNFSGPEYLWSGWQDLASKAPLLNGSPASMLDPRNSTFAAVARAREALALMNATDGTPELAVGIIDPTLLTNRSDPRFAALRQAFITAAQKANIKFPTKVVAGTYPGSLPAFQALLGMTLPKPRPGGIVLG